MQVDNRIHGKDWQLAGLRAGITGVIYGITSVLVGHPFDTIKTKMQAQSEYMNTKRTYKVVVTVWRREGIRGFYSGVFAPLVGSVVFRSIGVTAYGTLSTYWSHDPLMTKEIPFTFGFQVRSLVSALLASVVRAVTECPFEYAKVKRQTQKTWSITSIYKGFPLLYLKNTGMMITFIFIVDSLKRHTNLYESKRGQFFIAGFASSMAWILIWPIDNLNTMVQAELKNVGTTTKERTRWVIDHTGYKGLYRASVPGLLGVFIRNGTAMILMQRTAEKLAKVGIR
jgi:solute carrier family 25 carnitine/acylcarnitine transporter 20/29